MVVGWSRLYLGLVDGLRDGRECPSEFRSFVLFHLEDEVLGLRAALLDDVLVQVLGLGLSVAHLGRISFGSGLVCG